MCNRTKLQGVIAALAVVFVLTAHKPRVGSGTGLGIAVWGLQGKLGTKRKQAVTFLQYSYKYHQSNGNSGRKPKQT